MNIFEPPSTLEPEVNPNITCCFQNPNPNIKSPISILDSIGSCIHLRIDLKLGNGKEEEESVR